MPATSGTNAMQRAAASRANYEKQMSLARLQRVRKVLKEDCAALYDVEQHLINAGKLEPMSVGPGTPKKKGRCAACANLR